MTETEQRIVTAYCPECQALIPIVTITFITQGRWHKRVEMQLDGDATDYVAHLWAHEHGITDPP
jgi:hypothetical protein